MSQITHTGSPARQLVSAGELRRILRRAGDSLTRPSYLRAGDEWDAGASPCRFCSGGGRQHEAACPTR